MCRNPETGKLMPLDGPEFANCMTNWGIPPGELRKAVISGLEDKVMAEQKPVDVFPMWHRHPDAWVWYANIENTHLLTFTSLGPLLSHSLSPNGTYGIWMYCPSGGLPRTCLEHMQKWEGSGLEVRDTLLCRLIRAKYEVEGGITQEDMEFLFLARLLAGCMPEAFRHRNIAMAISDREASGKTTLFSYPGWLFEGPSFKPTVLTNRKDTDQLETIMTQKAILLADNVDTASDIAQGILCTAATTGRVSKRAHYKNFELAEADLRADVYMTGLRIPRSYRTDLLSRMLVFKLAVQEQDGLSETQRFERFISHRDEMLGEVLSRLEAIFRDEQRADHDAKRTTNYRIKDFALFLLRQEGLYGREAKVAALLNALAQQQQDAGVENSAIEPVLDHMVACWTGSARRNRYTGASLWNEMASVHRLTAGGKFYFEDAKSLVPYLKSRQDMLRKRWGLTLERDKTGERKNQWWVLLPSPEQVAAAKERAQHERSPLDEERTA
jgi:hypothetical protein